MSRNSDDERAEERAFTLYEEIDSTISDILHRVTQRASFQELNKQLHLLAGQVSELLELSQYQYGIK